MPVQHFAHWWRERRRNKLMLLVRGSVPQRRRPRGWRFARARPDAVRHDRVVFPQAELCRSFQYCARVRVVVS